MVFDGEGRFAAAVLRPAKRPGGAEIRAHLRRLVRAIRANWPAKRILIRDDSHYCGPLVIDWCRANSIDFIPLATTSILRRHVRPHASRRRQKRPRQALTRAGDSRSSSTWPRAEPNRAHDCPRRGRPAAADTRFIVTNLEGGRAKALYEEVYCRLGMAANM